MIKLPPKLEFVHSRILEIDEWVSEGRAMRRELPAPRKHLSAGMWRLRSEELDFKARYLEQIRANDEIVEDLVMRRSQVWNSHINKVVEPLIEPMSNGQFFYYLPCNRSQKSPPHGERHSSEGMGWRVKWA